MYTKGAVLMGEQLYKRSTWGKVLAGLGYAVCVLLALIFVINVTMIVKSYKYPDKVPDILGYKWNFRIIRSDTLRVAEPGT